MSRNQSYFSGALGGAHKYDLIFIIIYPMASAISFLFYFILFFMHHQLVLRCAQWACFVICVWCLSFPAATNGTKGWDSLGNLDKPELHCVLCRNRENVDSLHFVSHLQLGSYNSVSLHPNVYYYGGFSKICFINLKFEIPIPA